MSSYSEGFKLGYSANAPLAGISEGIQKFTQEYRKQEEIGRQRQEAYDQARSEFKKKQEETYGKYAKEDLYDNTGFTDFDTLGDKFTKSARETYEINEFAFRNGFIDESELTARNNTLKAQSQKLTTLYNDANAFIEEKKKLEEEGKSNPLNDKKLEILEDFSKQVKVSAGLDGLYLSTIGKEGKQRNISVSEFNKILNSESGVDLDSTYENLLSNQGFTQRLASGKKITEFITKEGDDMTALDAQLLSMTDGQQLGALLSITDVDGNNVATTDEKEVKEKGIIYVDAARVIDPSISVEEQKKLKSSMIDQLRAMQERKKKTEIYNDPYKQRETASSTAKKDRLDASFDLALQATNGGEISENAVNKIKSINPEVTNMFGGVDEGVFVIQKKTKDGRLEDIPVDIIYNKDGSYNHVETAKAIFNAVDPKANPGDAETAAEIYTKRHPDYEYSQNPVSFGGYAELPSADLIFMDEDRRTSALDKAYKEFDSYVTSLSNAEEDIREALAKGYRLSESSGYQITSKGSLLGGGKAVEVKISDGTSFIFGSDMGKSEFLQKFNEMVNVISRQKSIKSTKSTDQSSKNFG